MATTRTIARALAGRRRQRPTTPAYLAERTAAGSRSRWAEAARARRRLANGLLALGVRKGDASRSSARRALEWCALRLRARARSARSARRSTRTARRTTAPTCSSTPSRSACSSRTTSSSRRSRATAPSSPAPARAHLRRPGRARGARPRARRRASGRARRGEPPRSARTTSSPTSTPPGTTGPPKGCMIRHRNYYEMAAVVDEMEQRFVGPGDTLLLYLPLAHNFGRLIHLQARYVGYTLAFCRDPLRRRRGARGGAADRLPERAARVREGARRRRRPVRRGDRRPAARSVDWALGVGRRVSALRQAGEAAPALARPAAPHRRPARLLEGEGAARRPAARRELRRRAALAARSRSSSTRSTSSSSRATA